MNNKTPKNPTTPTNTKKFFKLTLAFLIPFTLILTIQTFWVHNYWVPSESMSPTLKTGDRLFATTTNNNYTPTHGDIIIFNDTKNWLQGTPEGYNKLIKRVIATPGDTIKCCTSTGQNILNNKPLNEPYLPTGTPNEPFPEQTIPPNHVFVMGDNRTQSADSRYHIDTNNQFINTKDIIAKAYFRYYPFNKMGPPK